MPGGKVGLSRSMAARTASEVATALAPEDSVTEKPDAGWPLSVALFW